MVNLFHHPEKGLPITPHSLRPIRAFIQHGCPCYKFSYLFQLGHFTFYSHPQHPPPPLPHHQHQGNLDFLIGGSHFSSERSTISDSSNKFFEGLWQKKRWLTLTLTLPTHHHHQGMVGGLHFSSEKGSDKNIWLWIPAILTRVGAWVQVKTGTSPH